jgi:glycosyltransferase involved in cell wall biosynthesis
VDRGFDPAKLFLTGRGYDPGRYNVEGRPTSTGAFNACFVGSGGPRKGLHYALEAWAKSGAAAGGGKFRIAGNLSPSYLKVLEPLLQDPSVELVGSIDDAAPLMRASDVLILPSLEEASAKATYEARGCGCVLVVSDRSAGPAVHNQDAMVHAAGNVDELTDHLRTLLTDREALERIRAESLLVAKRSTWSDAASRLISAYTSVAAPNRPD